MKKRSVKIALAGNPNCGKTSIFNILTGTRQHVGNYPGVTVESKSGHLMLDGIAVELVDLPGVYSISSSSPEEKVVFDELTTPGIDLILNVIDSSIPQRSLYLTTQLAELHIPMLLVFNMADDAKKKGLKYDIPKLEKYFGSPIVQTIGNSGAGIDNLREKIIETLNDLDSHGSPMLSYGADIDDAIGEVAGKIDELKLEKYNHIPSRFFAIKLLENDNKVNSIPEFSALRPHVREQIAHLHDKHAIEADTFMADCRYAMLAGACRDTITATLEKRQEISDKIDMVMTNKFLGLPIFFAIMYLTFWFTFTCSAPLMVYIEAFFSWMCGFIKGVWPETFLPFFRDLIADGIISGVGGVIVFLPNILFLFFAISLLEDSGYMARAAFVMDGIMRKFGLQGRSFVPLVLGFGCTVPAIMATRSIESERDRNVTIMVLPLMSCSARLPIYALIIPAFFAQRYQATMMFIIYLIGVVIALTAARVMKATLFKGDGEVYLMELPPYRMPTLKTTLLHLWDRGKMYLHKAGTIILFTSIILYICNTYPEKKVFSKDYDAAAAQLQKTDAPGTQEQITALENEKMSETFSYTISGRIGKFLQPLFAPLGFDDKVATAAIGALAAKEVFVAQMGILYSAGETDEKSEELRLILQKHYTPLQAFCIMIFALLSIPCLATLAVIKREMNSWKMMFCEAGGLFLLAYTITFIVYQVGSLLNIGTTFIQ